MPRRRLSVVIAAGALAVLALAGCRTEPGNAAFVADTTHTKVDVQKVLDEIKRDFPKLDRSFEGRVRQLIAQDQVFVDVASRYAAEQHAGQPTLDLQTQSQKYGLPPGNAFIKLEAQADGYRNLLLEKAKPVNPSEDDLHAVYQNLTKSGLTAPYEAVAPQLKQVQQLPYGIGLRAALTDAVHRYDVQINPLYGSADFPLLVLTGADGKEYTAVVLPLSASTGKPVVSDVATSR
jgi:hypothetical protein